MLGVPQAAASLTLSPQPSRTEVATSTCARASRSISSSRLMRPRNVTPGGACCSSRVRSGPSPITHIFADGRLCVRRRKAASAS
jgi:hypothetical protein